MKVSDILVEKIVVSYDFQHNVLEAFRAWLSSLNNTIERQDTSVHDFLISNRHQIKSQIQPIIEKMVNQELHKNYPDHFCKVVVHLVKSKKSDGEVNTQWEIINYEKFVNTMRLYLSLDEIYYAISRESLDRLAIHLTSVTMHEMVHLEQGARSAWKSANPKHHFGNVSKIKKRRYYTDIKEIDAHAQQTASKIIMYCLNSDDPADSFKQIIPLIRKQHKFLIGRDTSHQTIVELLSKKEDPQSKRALQLYFKKVYEKITDFLNS